MPVLKPISFRQLETLFQASRCDPTRFGCFLRLPVEGAGVVEM